MLSRNEHSHGRQQVGAHGDLEERISLRKKGVKQQTRRKSSAWSVADEELWNQRMQIWEKKRKRLSGPDWDKSFREAAGSKLKNKKPWRTSLCKTSTNKAQLERSDLDASVSYCGIEPSNSHHDTENNGDENGNISSLEESLKREGSRMDLKATTHRQTDIVASQTLPAGPLSKRPNSNNSILPNSVNLPLGSSDSAEDIPLMRTNSIILVNSNCLTQPSKFVKTVLSPIPSESECQKLSAEMLGSDERSRHEDAKIELTRSPENIFLEKPTSCKGQGADEEGTGWSFHNTTLMSEQENERKILEHSHCLGDLVDLGFNVERDLSVQGCKDPLRNASPQPEMQRETRDLMKRYRAQSGSEDIENIDDREAKLFPLITIEQPCHNFIPKAIERILKNEEPENRLMTEVENCCSTQAQLNEILNDAHIPSPEPQRANEICYSEFITKSDPGVSITDRQDSQNVEKANHRNELLVCGKPVAMKTVINSSLTRSVLRASCATGSTNERMGTQPVEASGEYNRCRGLEYNNIPVNNRFTLSKPPKDRKLQAIFSSPGTEIFRGRKKPPAQPLFILPLSSDNKPVADNLVVVQCISLEPFELRAKSRPLSDESVILQDDSAETLSTIPGDWYKEFQPPEISSEDISVEPQNADCYREIIIDRRGCRSSYTGPCHTNSSMGNQCRVRRYEVCHDTSQCSARKRKRLDQYN